MNLKARLQAVDTGASNLDTTIVETRRRIQALD
jgi:hypothetical protein